MNAPNCDNGYRLNSLTNECEDIDECGDDRPCGAHGSCINQVPGYNCECNVGYEFDVSSLWKWSLYQNGWELSMSML